MKLYFQALAASIAISMGMAAAQTMSLKDCMSHALENSIRMKSQKTETDDARTSRRDAVLQAFTPSVSGGTYAYSNFGRSVDPETNTYVSTASFNNGYSVSGSMVLFNGFTAINNMKISRTALKMGIEQEELAADEICLATMEAYFNAIYLKELCIILRSQVETAENSLTLVSRQEELGQKGHADVIGMEAELADRQYRLVEANNRYADAILALKDLMYWPLDKELVIDDPAVHAEDIAIMHPEEETTDIISNAMAFLPSVAIAKAQMENSLTRLRTAKWQFSPYITLNAGWSTSYYTYPGMQGYVPTPYWNQFVNNGGEYIQISLSIPIYDRLNNYSEIRRKKNEHARASLQYEQKIRDVESEVRRAVQDRDGAAAAFRQADLRADVQEEAYHLNIRKFDQGLISPIDYSKAGDDWLEAQTTRLNTLLTFYLKRSVVDYYNGISYIRQF